jgi:sugar phosphate isomerase/epimerase
MLIRDFGMDTLTLAGSLPAKLQAIREAGFSQVMLSARDLSDHVGGAEEAIGAVRASGLRATGLQVLRDFEGLSGHLHGYKVDIAKSMIEMCAALGCRLLLACSSTSQHATDDPGAIAKDLRRLAMLARPHGIRVAYEALSWGRHINEFTTAWKAVERADMPNLGLGIDSYHIFATQTPLEGLDGVDPRKVFLVQLSDFLWQEVRTPEERMATARTFRVFPGEGVHTELLTELVQRLDGMGYAGDYSFEVFNNDYLQMPAAHVAERARRSAAWLAGDVLRRAVPLPTKGTCAALVDSKKGNAPGVSTSGRLCSEGWQACSRHHVEGLTDAGHWQFETGPRARRWPPPSSSPSILSLVLLFSPRYGAGIEAPEGVTDASLKGSYAVIAKTRVTTGNTEEPKFQHLSIGHEEGNQHV